MTTTIKRRLPPQRLITAGNPVVRAVLGSPLHGALDRALLVLHVVGRRTGRHYDIPVSYAELDGSLVVVTQHRWRANLRAGADVEVTLRGHRRLMHARLDEDPASVSATLERLVGRLGPRTVQQLTGLELSHDVDVTRTDLEAAARAYGLATVTLR
jgi:deazaflavin-dependent oxidoreductase (nitroreductase family)